MAEVLPLKIQLFVDTGNFPSCPEFGNSTLIHFLVLISNKELLPFGYGVLAYFLEENYDIV